MSIAPVCSLLRSMIQGKPRKHLKIFVTQGMFDKLYEELVGMEERTEKWMRWSRCRPYELFHLLIQGVPVFPVANDHIATSLPAIWDRSIDAR